MNITNTSFKGQLYIKDKDTCVNTEHIVKIYKDRYNQQLTNISLSNNENISINRKYDEVVDSFSKAETSKGNIIEV